MHRFYTYTIIWRIPTCTSKYVVHKISIHTIVRPGICFFRNIIFWREKSEQLWRDMQNEKLPPPPSSFVLPDPCSRLYVRREPWPTIHSSITVYHYIYYSIYSTSAYITRFSKMFFYIYLWDRRKRISYDIWCVLLYSMTYNMKTRLWYLVFSLVIIQRYPCIRIVNTCAAVQSRNIIIVGEQYIVATTATKLCCYYYILCSLYSVYTHGNGKISRVCVMCTYGERNAINVIE